MDLLIDDASMDRRRYTPGNGTLTTAGAGARSLRVIEAYEAREIPERRVAVFPVGGIHVAAPGWTAIARVRHGFGKGAVPIIARWQYDRTTTATPYLTFKSRIVVDGQVLREVTHSIRTGARLGMGYWSNEAALAHCVVGGIYWQQEKLSTVDVQVETVWATQSGVSHCKNIVLEIG